MVSVDMVWAMTSEHIASFPQVSPSESVDALKLLLAPKVKAPPVLVSLVFEGAVLEGAQTLESLRVAEDAFVTLHVVRSAVTAELRQQIREFVDWRRSYPPWVQVPAIDEVSQCFVNLADLADEPDLWHAFELASTWIWSVSDPRIAEGLEKLLAAFGASYGFVSSSLSLLQREVSDMESDWWYLNVCSNDWWKDREPSVSFSALSSASSHDSGHPDDFVHQQELEACDPSWKELRGHQRFRQVHRSYRHQERMNARKARNSEAGCTTRKSPRRKVKHGTLRVVDYEASEFSI